MLVIDPDGHVLLFRGFDPGRPELGSYWFTPGGGLDDGESFEDAARRELREETGLVVDDVGPRLFERRIEFAFEENHFSQTEQFFCVRAERFEVDNAEWTDIEQRSVIEHRWWSAAELAATDEQRLPGRSRRPHRADHGRLTRAQSSVLAELAEPAERVLHAPRLGEAAVGDAVDRGAGLLVALAGRLDPEERRRR